MSTKTGKRANWSGLYVSDRPRDLLGLTEAQEETIDQFIGFVGKDQGGEVKNANILVYTGTSAPTLTDYANTPKGTIIIAPFLTHSTLFVHRLQSTPAVVGDWEKIVAATVT